MTETSSKESVKESVKKALNTLRYDEQKAFKLSFELTNILAKDSDYAEDFIENDGLNVLIGLLKTTKGAFQGYVLAALRALLLYVNAIEQVADSPDLVEHLYVLLGDTRNLNVAKQTLEIFIVLVGMLPQGHKLINKAVSVRRGPDHKPYQYISNLVVSPDILVARNSLLFFNMMLTKRKEISDKKFKKLVFLFDQGGVMAKVKQLVTNGDEIIKKQLTVFQKLTGVSIPLSFYEAERWKAKFDEMKKEFDRVSESLFVIQQQQPKIRLMKAELMRAQETVQALSLVYKTSPNFHPTKRADAKDIDFGGTKIEPIADVIEDPALTALRNHVFQRIVTAEEFQGQLAKLTGGTPGKEKGYKTRGSKFFDPFAGVDDDDISGPPIAVKDDDDDDAPPPEDDDDAPPPEEDDDAPPPEEEDDAPPPNEMEDQPVLKQKKGKEASSVVQHAVTPGESIVQIAERYGVSPDAIRAALLAANPSQSLPISNEAALPSGVTSVVSVAMPAAAPGVATVVHDPPTPIVKEIPTPIVSAAATSPGPSVAPAVPMPGGAQAAPTGWVAPTWVAPATIPQGPKVQYWKGPTPVQKMRPFHWEKFNLENEKAFWNRIHAGEIDCTYNYEEFENMFSQKVVEKKEKKEEVIKVVLIEAKKFQNISIMLHKLPKIPQIQRGLLDLDDEVISKESLEAMIGQVPSPEDTKMWQTMKNKKPIEEYEPPEQFFAMTLATLEFEKRCKAWLFTRDWTDTVANVMKPIDRLAAAVQCVRNSKHLPFIMGVILGFGNLMNCGNAQKGNAPGFHFNTLNKLDAAKDKSGKISLFQYLITTLQRNNEAALDFGEEVKDVLNNVTSIKSEDIEKSVTDATGALNMFRLQVTEVKQKLENEGAGRDDVFIMRMTAFYQRAHEELKSLQSTQALLKANFIDILQWWGCPAHMLKDPKPEDFFNEFVPFVVKFRGLTADFLKEKKKQAKRGQKLGADTKVAQTGGDIMDAIVNSLQEKLVNA